MPVFISLYYFHLHLRDIAPQGLHCVTPAWIHYASVINVAPIQCTKIHAYLKALCANKDREAAVMELRLILLILLLPGVTLAISQDGKAGY